MAIFLSIAGGLVLHAGVKLPWYVAWIGTLPGDMIVKKTHMIFYVPLTSSLLLSACLSLVFSLFSSRGG